MTNATATRATIDDLYKVEGKAELIGGRIVRLMASGDLPGTAAEEIFSSLKSHVKQTKRGVAHADGIGFAVPELSTGRESFTPDASYFDGPRPANRMRFFQGPPTLAVEVRSENDYGQAAERNMEEKRREYFEAGTKAVLDVDPVNVWVRVYLRTNPATAIEFKRGDVIQVDSVVPGWRMPVEEILG